MAKQINRQVAVDSIHLAAFLITKSLPLAKVTRSGRLGVFYFDSNRASSEIQTYMSGQALVEPRSFIAAIRQLKMKIDDQPMGFGESRVRSAGEAKLGD